MIALNPAINMTHPNCRKKRTPRFLSGKAVVVIASRASAAGRAVLNEQELVNYVAATYDVHLEVVTEDSHSTWQVVDLMRVSASLCLVAFTTHMTRHHGAAGLLSPADCVCTVRASFCAACNCLSSAAGKHSSRRSYTPLERYSTLTIHFLLHRRIQTCSSACTGTAGRTPCSCAARPSRSTWCRTAGCARRARRDRSSAATSTRPSW